MAQVARQVQAQTQQQVQTLSPQQMLVVKLIELPTVELEDRVRAELIDNPALEEGPEPGTTDDGQVDEGDESQQAEDGGDTSYDDLSDYLHEDDIPDYRLRDGGSGRTDRDRAEDIPYADATSFYETLREQLGEHPLTDRQRQVGEYLIGSLDDDGLLRKPLDTLADDLAIYVGLDVSVDEIAQVLAVIQDFDPAGIGARSLQECLLIQLRRKREQDGRLASAPAERLQETFPRHPHDGLPEPSEAVSEGSQGEEHGTPDNPQRAVLALAEAILEQCYDDFTHKNWDKVRQRLSVSEEEVEAAVRAITRLNPRPGASLGEAIGRNMQQIVPDFIVETQDDGTISLTLNDRGVPQLRMSRTFTTLVEEHTKNAANQSRQSREAMLFLKQKMDAAQGFINAVRQRQATLTLTMQAIIDLQRPFFLEGDETLLRPMILRDVAERTGLDISTISRVTGSKYVQTNYGIFSLRHFFGDGYVTQDGEEMSVREIQRALRQIIDGEDKKVPLTDDELAARLKDRGYPIARRTVAKYRQQLSIPVARMRR